MIKEVTYRTEYGTSDAIQKLDILLSEHDKINIKKVQDFIKNNKFVSNARIDISGEVVLLDDGDTEVDSDEWRVGIEQFIVFENSFYYYSESKYDSSDNFESKELILSDF
jgi:hypothetical protein